MAEPRPDALAALTLIEAIGGVGTVVIGAYFLVEVNAIAASVGLGFGNVPDFYAFFAVEVAAGALALPAAYGLWARRGWGWSLSVYLGIAVIVFALGMGAYFVATYGDYTETEAALLPMVVSLGAVYYLDRPDSRRFFGK